MVFKLPPALSSGDRMGDPVFAVGHHEKKVWFALNEGYYPNLVLMLDKNGWFIYLALRPTIKYVALASTLRGLFSADSQVHAR